MRRATVAAPVAEILNACYFVRMNRRPSLREQRRLALQRLGEICRAAFNEAEDFEPLFAALIDGLSPRERDF